MNHIIYPVTEEDTNQQLFKRFVLFNKKNNFQTYRSELKR